MPVSYTHLDVYKRQQVCFEKILILFGCDTGSLKAVSYTHLDVYKRQAAHFSFFVK